MFHFISSPSRSLKFLCMYYSHWLLIYHNLCHISKQGICPGNRLKVISYEPTCYSPSPASSPCQSVPSIYYNTSILSSTDSILYENSVCGGPHIPVTSHQRHGKRRSWHIMPNKVNHYANL